MLDDHPVLKEGHLSSARTLVSPMTVYTVGRDEGQCASARRDNDGRTTRYG